MNNGILDGGIKYLEFLSQDTIFAAGRQGIIYRTYNGGNTWEIVYNDTSTTDYINKIKFFDSMNGIAMGDQSASASKMPLLNTTDGGNTWSNYNTRLTGGSSIDGVEFVSPSYVFSRGTYTKNGRKNAGIWKSPDRGLTWSFHTVGNSHIDSLTKVRNIVFKNNLKGFVAKYDSSLWITKDGGQLWEKIYQAPSYIRSLSLINNSNIIYCVGARGLITKIIFEPSILIKENIENSNESFTYCYFSNEQKGYLIDGNTNSDRFFTTFDNITDISESQKIFSLFTLYQNYPNPFNPTTTINYSIPDAKHNYTNQVTLKIYDILGTEVETLVNEIKQAGIHRVEFNAKNYSSGVYYYKMSAGDFIQTKKMILIK